MKKQIANIVDTYENKIAEELNELRTERRAFLKEKKDVIKLLRVETYQETKESCEERLTRQNTMRPKL